MSALAQVYELRPPSVLETLERNQSIWARWPGGNPAMGSMFFHPQDAAEIVARGWIMIDGVKAKTSWDAAEYGCRQTVRLEFEGAFRAHP